MSDGDIKLLNLYVHIRILCIPKNCFVFLHKNDFFFLNTYMKEKLTF